MIALELAALFAVAAVQTAMFTWVSRSRNSGDVTYHAWASMASNAVWFVTNLFIFKHLWDAWTKGETWQLAAAGVVYVVATTLGSCVMMWLLLRTEKGKRQVGAR